MALHARSARTLETVTLLAGEPFTAARLVDLGLTRKQLQPLIRAGAVRVERRGLFSVVDDRDEISALLERAKALATSIPDAVVSHESAALLIGLPHLTTMRKHREPHALTVTTPQRAHAGRHGYRTVSGRVPESQIQVVDGVAVTSVERTAVDIARMGTFIEGLAAIDAAMRLIVGSLLQPKADLRSSVHSDALIAEARARLFAVTDNMVSWPGAARARMAIRHGHPASESVLESASRGQMIVAELPIPLIGWPIDVDGLTYWVDALWRDQRVFGEADGDLKYLSGDPSVLLREKRRQDALFDSGLIPIRWNWHEAVVAPHLLIAKLRRRLS